MKKANEAKAEKYLNKPAMFNGQLFDTRKDALKNLLKLGYKAEIGTKSSVVYNRRKYNRMDWKEQQEYEQKLKTLVPCYKIVASDGSYFEVTKTDYDYFILINPFTCKHISEN